MFIFFRTEHLSITFWARTIYITFTWLSIKVVDANDRMHFFSIDWHGKSLIKHIALPSHRSPLTSGSFPYVTIPPCNLATSSNPSFNSQPENFSQRIPPVQ